MSAGHIAYANGLRELADWIEAHPTIALPNDEISAYGANEREEAAEILAAQTVRAELLERVFKAALDIRLDFAARTLEEQKRWIHLPELRAAIDAVIKAQEGKWWGKPTEDRAP